MTQQLIPPPELVHQWFQKGNVPHVADKAAQWGADQELVACCHYFARDLRESLALELRAARRPKPPSLKEQALKELAWVDKNLKGANFFGRCDAVHTIRRALEQLPDDN